jgi:hypothetical protein
MHREPIGDWLFYSDLDEFWKISFGLGIDMAMAES